MNKNIWIIALLVCNNIITYSQNKIQGKILYTISLKTPDISKLDKIKESKEIVNTAKEFFKNAQDVKASLLFNQTESLFKLESNMLNDSEKGINITRMFAGGDDIYYTNTSTKEYIEQTGNSSEGIFLITYNPTEWQLTQETKKIEKHLCYKAINTNTDKKQKIIAWYTPRIPVNLGPKGFNGLPGLILELDDDAITYKAIKITLNPKEKVVIKKPKKGIKITKEEYDKKLFEFGKSIGF